MIKRLYLAPFEANDITELLRDPSRWIIKNGYSNDNAELVWRVSVWGGNEAHVGTGDFTLINPDTTTPSPLALAAMQTPFFLPFYAEEVQGGALPDVQYIRRELYKLIAATCPRGIKRAQREFEKLTPQSVGKAATSTTETNEKARQRIIIDKLKAINGIATPERDVVQEDSTGGGITGTTSGTLDATPEDMLDNVSIFGEYDSPYAKAARKIAALTIPIDYEERDEQYSAQGRAWWWAWYGDDLKKAVVVGG